MIDYVCEVTAIIQNERGIPVEVVVACPIADDKQLSVFKDRCVQKVSFVDGICSKVLPRLQGWLPWAKISLSSRKLAYPSHISCGDTANEIVTDILKVYLAVVGGSYNG